MNLVSRLSLSALMVTMWAICPLFLGAQSNPTGQSAALPSESAGSCFAVTEPAEDSASRGFDLGNLDRSVKPCSDFFLFADGGWIKSHPIPADQASWNSFTKLREDNSIKLRGILEAAAKKTAAAPGSVEQKIGDFYAACMNEEQAEKAGGEPVRGEFARIARLASVADLQAEIARLQKTGFGVVFRVSSQADFKNSSMEIATVGQGGLGLPDRDYYTKTDAKSQTLRDAYVVHVQKMFQLVGEDAATAAEEAKTILALETKLAQASMTRVDQRNPDNVYHKMDRAGIGALTPHFSWDDYFQEIGYPAITSVNVRQPDFFKTLNAQLTETTLADWKVYLRWHVIHEAAPGLSSNFVNENFDFYGKTVTGAQQILPRWKRCVQSTDNYLGEALGQIYVKDYFPPKARGRALEMVQNLLAALRDDLGTLDWMSEATRKEALIKLNAIQLKIGYPDEWRNYSSYRVDRGSYFDNIVRGEEFEFNFRLAKAGKPVNRKEWGMTPPTVNAYYNPTINEIVFPAGILQPPFYDFNRDDAMNYGGMGAVIGHEMTHGFDDQGSRFDAQGNLRNWWTPEDLKNFKARGDCVANQFDAFVVEEGLHENGKLVEGESIADLGGLTIAYAALEKVLASKPKPGLIDGFTPEQRFFLAFAQVWAGNQRPEFARLMVNTNPHPLGRFRTIGPFSNMPAFAKAWGCTDGDAMKRPEAERCRIW
jgi:putative endopeptidase